MLRFFRPDPEAKNTITNFRLTFQEKLKTSPEVNTLELKNYLRSLNLEVLREIYREISYEGKMSQYKKEELLIKLQKLREPSCWEKLSVEQEHFKAMNDSMFLPTVLSKNDLTKRYPHLSSEEDHDHYNDTINAIKNAHLVVWSYTLVFNDMRDEMNIRDNQFYCPIL